MFRTKFVEKIETHFVFSGVVFFENCVFFEKMLKNIGRLGQSTDDNIKGA